MAPPERESSIAPASVIPAFAGMAGCYGRRGLKEGASMAKDDLLERVRQRTPACAKVGVFDVDGIFRGKYMAPDKLASELAGGFGFCDVVLCWDSSDQLYDNASF